MSDLISRSTLMKKLNDTKIQITFDLPVEEILGDAVDIDDFAMLVQDAIQAYRNMVIGAIKEQPTAFNVEKVVEQLEEWTFNADVNLGDGTVKNSDLIASENAIEIVERGGVNDD
ncbi:MAG: hypothetical protein II992_07125 [Lachnospiraceae bacterium]|nr:hypothetical protein [Lachnospiraceae bacterium]